MYNITKYSKNKAEKIGVLIRPSTRTGKKIDVFDRKGNYICSIGANGYGDYPYYLKRFGPVYANERKRLYKLRHEKDRKVKGTAGYYADKILW